MADVFLSYATDDRAQASRLAAFLEEQGYSVWWDRELAAGQRFDDVIGRELNDCKLAIVIWTSTSIKSRWVLGEAETAAGMEKLIPVRTDDVNERQLPIGFRALHTIAVDDREELLRAIQTRLAAPRQPLSRRTILTMRLGRHLRALRQWVTVGNAAIALIVILPVVYFLAISLHWWSIKDSMDPADFRAHLSKFPLSPFASRGRARLAGADQWEQIKKTKRAIELRRFIESYPTSIYYQFARLRLNRLDLFASGQYKSIVSYSSDRQINPQDLASLSCDSLWKAKNEMFYRLGFCFVKSSLADAFNTRADCPYNNCKVIGTFNDWVYDLITPIENTNNGILQGMIDQCRQSEPEEWSVNLCARNP